MTPFRGRAEAGAGYAAIVTAAGTSRRMGDSRKKEYCSLYGKPVLAHAALPFVQSGEFSRIVITVPRGHAGRAAEMLGPHVPSERLLFVEGGDTRQESVLRGLEALCEDPPHAVLIHDGARPWASLSLIDRVLRCAELFGACVPLWEASEAVKIAGDFGLIVRHMPRGAVRFAQTPQGFGFERILAAHRRAAREGIRCADDAELFELYEGPVAWVDGEAVNRKITYPHDLPE